MVQPSPFLDLVRGFNEPGFFLISPVTIAPPAFVIGEIKRFGVGS